MELDTLAPYLVLFLPMILSIYYKDRAVVVLATDAQGTLKATFSVQSVKTLLRHVFQCFYLTGIFLLHISHQMAQK